MTQPSTAPLRAIVCAVLGYAFWTLAEAFMKLAGQAHTPPFQIAAGYGAACGVTVFLFALWRGRVSSLKPKRIKMEIVRAVVLTGLSVANVIAFTHLQLTQVYVVVFAAPISIAVGAALFMNEPLSWRHGLAIVAGFIGVMIAIDPTHIDIRDDAGAGYMALPFCLIFFVISMLMARVLGKTENTESMALWPQVGRFALTLPVCLWTFASLSPLVWVYVLGAGFLGAFGWLLIMEAFRNAPATIVAPTHYSQIVFGAILGVLVWHNEPSTNLIVGAAVIIASSLYLAQQARTQKAEAVPAHTETPHT